MRRKSNYPTIKEFTPGHFMKSIFISVSSKFKRSDLISKSQALLILELSVITGDNNTRKEKKKLPVAKCFAHHDHRTEKLRTI